MKKIKKIKATISTLLASAIVASSASAIYASATAPSAYVDITYSDGVYTANVIFENMPEIQATAFSINIEDGWELVINDDEFVLSDTNSFYNQASSNVTYITESGIPYVAFAFGSDHDVNGVAVSFSIRKTSNFSSSTSAINIDFIALNSSTTNYIDTDENPIMLKANEFIVGDANGDGIVDATDSSTILAGIENHPTYKVYNIRKTYHNYFIGAKAAAAPDANQNGYINQTDADLVLDYYVDKTVGNAYSGPIGTIDVYEVFE